jgi:IPT/TIG domain
MNFYRTRKWIVALLALVLVVAMAGCKGESSPTAPSGTGGTTGTTGTTSTTGTVTPPVGASLTLTVSNSTPLVSSSAVITATVTSGGTAVPNGTAVEYQTDFGTFVQGASADVQKIIKTTTNGVATATIFSSAAGAAAITATVNNVTKATTVTFVTVPIITQPPPKTPTITSVTPSVGSPNGGQTVTITGTNFRTPLKLLYDTGTGASPIELPIIASTQTDTVIQFITPKVNLGAGQQLKINLTVITQQGTSSEQKVTAAAAFTFQADVLTPAPTTVSPASGPIDGGTRVTIFGSGFQAPVQVFFGASEAQVIKTVFDQIVVITPTARAAGVTTGTVDIRIINVTSATTATLTAGFAYAEKMSITAVGPTQGPVDGGTRVTIDGSGFDTAGVAVVIGGIAAQPVFVSGTKIIAITGAPVVTSCANVVGPTQVVNINNGDSATGVPFTFLLPKPAITNITPPTVVIGANVNVTVLGAFGTPRILIGGQSVPISNTVVNNDGTTTFTVVVPSNLTLLTVSCPGAPGATAPIPTSFDVAYTSVTTTCTDTVTKGLLVNPLNVGIFTLVPPSFGSFQATITPAQAGPPPVPASVKPSASQTVTIVDTGAGPVVITGSSTTDVTAGGCSHFAITLPTAQTLNQCDTAPILAQYNGQTSSAVDQCKITINYTINSVPNSKSLTLTGISQ